MRVALKESFRTNGFFQLQDNDWLLKQRRAGKIAAQTLNHLEKLVKNRTNLSMSELDKLAEAMIVSAGGIPTFKNYKGFPATVCISVNDQLVHGIPSSYVLKDGDIVTFDLGVTCDGAIADSAITCIFGTPKSDHHVKLVSATYEALDKGIAAIAVDKKLGVIGNAIYKSAKGNGFSVITKYGGHGLSWNAPHAPPFVNNRSEIDDGFRIQPGLVLAIEPMLVDGTTNTRTLSDGWTVVADGLCAHVEHSVFVHNDRVEVITDRTNI
jgi:methionyl aminopeptidase